MNRRINVLSAFVLLTVLIGTLTVACASTETAPGTLDGKALKEERCTVCHDPTRIERAKKTSDEWRKTVERMISNGAKLNDDEQAAVIEYLSEAYPN